MVAFDHVLQYLVVRIVSSRFCHVGWRARVRARCVVVEAERQARLRPIVQRNGKNRSRRFRVDRFSIPSADKTCYGTCTMAECIRTKKIKKSFQYLCRNECVCFLPMPAPGCFCLLPSAVTTKTALGKVKNVGTKVLRYFGRRQRMTDDSLEAHTFSFLTAYRQDHRSSPHPRQPTQQRDLLACYSRFVARRPTWPQ
jgi:hypothetical protein